MIEATPRGADDRLGYSFEEFDPEQVWRNGTADEQMNPVDHWWLDA